MIESGSSLFYLFHCSAHDRLNTMTFRSFRNIPHGLHHGDQPRERVEARLCLSTSRTDCIIQRTWERTRSSTLPQHIPHGLHQQNRTDAMPQIHAICCELVDSFSDSAKAASALTIFPCSSTVKAIYIAIIDSLGRTIDRFSVRTAPKKSVSLRFAESPCWMGSSAVRTIVESFGYEAAQIADNLVQGFPGQSFLIGNCNAAIKTLNRDLAGFDCHPAYHSIAEKVIWVHNLLIDDYTDWL